ncbi:MAG TPA: hypothetical protein VKX46_19060 [Ktedonobacteraceae bacterium]|nr:hypothetical protein [Ktedonobacteraceae bacterium]
MSKDHLERKTYRKSPGRQYGYDYDPLRSNVGQSQSGSRRGETASRPGALLAQRPDPKRTRQLLRQSIIASKAQAIDEEMGAVGSVEPEPLAHYQPLQEQWEGEPTRSRRPASQSGRQVSPARPAAPPTRKLPAIDDDRYADYDSSEIRSASRSGRLARPVTRGVPDQEERGAWRDYDETMDSDLEYDDPFDVSERSPSQRPAPNSRVAGRIERQRYDDEYYDDGKIYEDLEAVDREDNRPPVGRLRKKNKLSRRNLLMGAGAVALGAGIVSAYELAPKVPQAIGNVGSNVEHQVQDAFNKGVAQGANDARKQLLSELDTIESFTLDGALSAAALTRKAYDVFVSPVVKFGAALTSDFLKAMRDAFKTARGILININQDNATLAAIQEVLNAWVDQADNLPKQLDAITQTDLDGAQAYLRALQRKIADEKAKLNNATPTATAAPSSHQTPTSKPAH